jgi:Gas vesicle synthesis protein GvpL/GvpF
MADERLDAWAAEHAPEVLARARAGALRDAERVLRGRLAAALVDAAAGPDPAPAPEPAPATGGGALLWCYGIVPASATAPRRPGVDGAAVEAIAEGRLAALVSAVPEPRYRPEAITSRLEDLDELERLSRAHDAVLEDALADGDVLPFRLCTLYESPASLRTMLARDADSLGDVMSRIAGRAEWGVKAFLQPPASANQAPSEPASGAEYLARRREQREVAVAVRDEIDHSVAGIHARLADRASAAVLSRPQDRRLTGRDEEMVLNGAYLVPRDAAAGFAAVVDELRAQHSAHGIALELTGPWPAYHFTGEAEA